MVKTTIEVDDDLWRRFSLLVLRERGERKKNEVIAQLLKSYVEGRGFKGDPQRLDYILRVEEEREAFQKFKDELIKDPGYNGKFMAVFQGAVIGCDEDKGKLVKSVYDRYGYVPVYVDKVTPGGRRVEVPSPELVRHEV